MKNNNLMIAGGFNIPAKIEKNYLKPLMEKKIWMNLVNSVVIIFPGLDHILMVGSFISAWVMVIWNFKKIIL